MEQQVICIFIDHRGHHKKQLQLGNGGIHTVRH